MMTHNIFAGTDDADDEPTDLEGRLDKALFAARPRGRPASTRRRSMRLEIFSGRMYRILFLFDATDHVKANRILDAAGALARVLNDAAQAQPVLLRVKREVGTAQTVLMDWTPERGAWSARF